jgi:hypothetical protein
MTSTAFQPLKILPPADPQAVKREGGLCFLLSVAPPEKWLKLIVERWRNRQSPVSDFCLPALTGNEIRFNCSLADLPIFFNYLKADVDLANRQYIELMELEARAAAHLRQVEEERKLAEQKQLQEVLTSLDFD